MNPLWLLLGVCTASEIPRLPELRSLISVDNLAQLPPNTVATLASSWLEQYQNFKGKLSVDAVKPFSLKSKTTSYRYNQNADDMRAWTKYLVEAHKAQATIARAAPDFDVDAFIDFLIRHKHFRPKDLEFLRRPGLDYGQEQIERELNKIKQKQEEEESKTIDIGGETIEGSALCIAYSNFAVVAFAAFLLL